MRKGKIILLCILGSIFFKDINAQLCPDDNHPHMIDMGFVSGTKWACCNVGATKPEEYGSYFAWGETEKQSEYSLSSYKHMVVVKELQNGRYYPVERAKNLGSYINGTNYDVAHIKWGGSWQMPSFDQIKELLDNTTSYWYPYSTSLRGVKGKMFKSKVNGNIIFLPFAGRRYESQLYSTSEDGYYWSGTQNPNRRETEYAYYLHVSNRAGDLGSLGKRCGGFSVRPVTNTNKKATSINANYDPTYNQCPDNNHPHMIDLGLPSGTLWACCNVGATKPEEKGKLYAWGETQDKSIFTPKTYQHCNGKIWNCYDIGTHIASTKYDVAFVKWGNSWQMPTRDQFKELILNIKRSEIISIEGKDGARIYGPNGGSIFLPFAGASWYDDGRISSLGDIGEYWSETVDPAESQYAFILTLNIYSSSPIGRSARNIGHSVRPVAK